MAVEDSKDDGFLNEFIDDLYAEYDERLGLIRKGLLSLEAFINKPITDETLLDSILRHCHTLKGLAATVNIGNAEQLIHHIESYLRTVQKNQIFLTSGGMEILFQGFKCLEQIIIAYRTKSPIPGIQEIITALTRGAEITPPEIEPPPVVTCCTYTPCGAPAKTGNESATAATTLVF
ncbi:MAG: hypothetical protein BWK79_04050 [Beggiatoa sp. IS2]|nr:MAG: hypothetical protein BWK79_04050 [Beggiatoa sp. IS2]